MIPVSARVRRLVIVILTFVCAGPVIQAVTEALLTTASLLLSGSGEEVHWMRGIAPRYLREMLVSSMVTSGLTGAIAGVCETWFGPLRAGGMFAVSLVIPAAVLALLIVTVPPFTDVVASGNVRAVFIFLGPTMITGAAFVVSMMACFRVVRMVTGPTAGAGRRLSP